MNFADFWVASSQHVAIKYMLVRPPQLFLSGGYKALKMVQIRSPIPIEQRGLWMPPYSTFVERYGSPRRGPTVGPGVSDQI